MRASRIHLGQGYDRPNGTIDGFLSKTKTKEELKLYLSMELIIAGWSTNS